MEEKINGVKALAGLEAPGELDEQLRAAARESLTPEEIRAQTISFIMGTLPEDSTTSREYVEEMLNRQYGTIPS